MAARWAKGLCFNCDSTFTPDHRCRPALFLCLLDEPEDPQYVDDNPPPDPDPSPLETISTDIVVQNTPSISFHALRGQPIPSTSKVAGSINGKEVIVLVDGGSTNNFVQTKLAKHLNLVVQPSAHRRVTVGNGDALSCDGECLNVPLTMGSATFNVDLILLPIYGADVVLGVQWMRQLSQILFEYNELWVEFDYLGQKTRLHGLNQIQCDPACSASLKKSSAQEAQFYQLLIEPVIKDPNPTFGSDIPVFFLQELKQTLADFQDIFSVPSGLPPA